LTVPEKGHIFISYRRADSAGYAGRIYDRLTAHFGKDAVFMDVDTIEAGVDFVEVLQNAVQSCDVLVALIGRSWLNIKDVDGKRRLDNPEDFVRIEVAAALSRDIRVIPVLVDGALMPHSTELPENLKSLARRNALQVHHQSFNADARRLISQLELALKAAEDSRILKARKLEEEKERKEKRAREKAEAEERIRLTDGQKAKEEIEPNDADEKARKTREARKKAKAEEQKYLQGKEKLTQQIIIDRLQQEKEERNRKVASDELPGGTREVAKFSRHPLLTGGGVILILICLIIGGTAVYKAMFPQPVPEPTDFPRSVSTPTDLPDLHEVGDTMVSEKDGMTMVYIPAGDFQMGSDESNNNERTVHTEYLDAFWIDQTEVTNAMYARCVAAEVCDAPTSNESHTRDSYYRNPEFDDYPVVYVSWSDANAYCEWADRHLPAETEWEKAAGWDDGAQAQRVYPWGDVIDYSYANYNQDVGDTTSVGRYQKGVSFYGAYDMAGNVSEWAGNQVLRGGSWSDDDYSVRSAYRVWYGGGIGTYDLIGFRCTYDGN